MTSLIRRWLLVAAGAIALAACAAPDVTTYANQRPVFELERYFNGKVEAHGMFTDRSGKVVKRFQVVMDCKWQGDEGVLDEDFTYSDGTKQRRVWRVSKLGNGNYVGRADDVVGEAKGQSSGNALRWNYTLGLDVDGTTWEVQS